MNTLVKYIAYAKPYVTVCLVWFSLKKRKRKIK
jgi:hypothetical protein